MRKAKYITPEYLKVKTADFYDILLLEYKQAMYYHSGDKESASIVSEKKDKIMKKVEKENGIYD